MRNYVSRLHLVLVVILALLTVGLALVGWSLRPASGGYSPVPIGMELSLTASPQARTLLESVTPSGEDGAMLTIVATSGDLPDVVTEGPWTLLVTDLGSGVPCAPSYGTVDYKRVHIERPHFQRHFTLRIGASVSHVARITGNGPFFIRLCWPSKGPAALNGAYLSSRIPPLYVDMPKEPVVTRQIHLGSFDTADFTIDSLPQPTNASPNAWQWTAPAKLASPQALAFAAVNSSETQHETYKAFLSGIFFGIAGGALVSLIAELVAPFRSRQERRSSEPGG
jgi:hypothetical protein